MRLREWCDIRGRGVLKWLERETGVSYTTIHGLYSERQVATYATAVKISKATRGKVTIGELCTHREEPRRSARAAS